MKLRLCQIRIKTIDSVQQKLIQARQENAATGGIERPSVYQRGIWLAFTADL